MRITRRLEPSTWERFLAQCPQATIFHTPAMFEVFNRTEGHTPEVWAAVLDSGDVLALFLPVQITLMGGLMHRLTTRAVAYSHPLAAPGQLGTVAAGALMRHYEQSARGSILFTEIRNMIDTPSISTVLHTARFTYEPHLNYLVDLRKPRETLWNAVSRSGRQSIKSARNKGAMVVDITEREQLTAVYRLFQHVYARAEIPLADKSLFDATFDVLVDRDMLRAFAVCKGDEYVAACILLLYKDRAIYWYAGTSRDTGTSHLTELLVWHAMCWSAEHGYHVFDFGGAGKPDEPYGVRDFKAKFGGELVNHGRHVCVHAPALLGISRFGYRFRRQILNARRKSA